VERFHAFPLVERLRTARERMAYFDQHPDEVPCDLVAQREFVQKGGPAIDATVTRLWGDPNTKGWPGHWTPTRKLWKRAEAVGLSAKYHQYYSHLSWYVHCAHVGAVGLDKTDMHMVYANALELMRYTVPDTFWTVGKELKFHQGIDDFLNKVSPRI
jgi:hypothetical protein